MSSPAVVSDELRVVSALRFALAFLATVLLITGWASADVMALMPERIVVENMDNHGDLVFVLYLEGQFDRGVLLDPKAAERVGDAVQLPPGPQEGRLSILGVSRRLVGEGRALPDPAWLDGPAPGVVRISGVIHHYPVEKSRVLHQYKLEKVDDGLKVTLLNPDVLTPYPPEDWMLETKSSTPYLWIGLAGGVAALIAGVVAFWSLKRQGSRRGTIK